MPVIKNFDRNTCKALAAAMEKALQTVAADFGVAIVQAGGSFADAEYKAKFLVKVTDAGAVEAAERKEFAQLCALYELPASAYGAEIKLSGGTGKLIGFATRRERMPIKVRRADGKVYVTTEAAVKHLKVPYKPTGGLVETDRCGNPIH